MSDYVLTCSSVADLPVEFTKEHNIDVIPYTVYIDGKEYLDDQGQSISNKELYQMMRDGASPSTSMINFERYTNFFRPFLEEGKDILHLEFASTLSGAYGNAVRAARELMKEFPDRTIKVVDTKSASGGMGLIVRLTEEKKEESATLEEAATFAEEIIPKIPHWFVVGDLEYLRRGGRLSRASALIGTMLNIKPVLGLNNDGNIVPVEKIRGRKKSIQSLLTHAEDEIVDNGAGQTIIIVHADAAEEAEKLAADARAKFPEAKEVVVDEMGPVIGAHTGPGSLGMTFIGSGRPDISTD